MSLHRITCYTVTCDECRTAFDETGADYLVHFDTADAAIGYIAEYGWALTEDGHVVCRACIARALCTRAGHHFTEWTPCACHGLVPDHALYGCGLLRACLRDGCGQLEERTLAQLPTTPEPTTPGG